MDCKKVGNLIYKLRTEQGYTQQQVADLLRISNKTVSKWECGLGCPDASLWPELAAVLGADIQKMLEGKLEENAPDIGKIDKVRFYVCGQCGNILVSTGGASISCCGRKLHPLKAKADSGEYKVSAQEMDTDYFLSLSHEMSKAHYISFVASVTYDRVLLICLYPEQSAEVRIPLARRGSDLYIYCTKHGLHKLTGII